MPNIVLLHPINPAVITQPFGGNAATYAQFGLKGHNGIDYRTTFDDSPNGKRDVLAPYWGDVTQCANDGAKVGYGKHIRLKLPGGGEIVLGHLDKFLVKVGDKVTPGQVIAISDNTGFSTGSHLHFGYRPAGFNTANGYSGYVDQSPLLTNDLQKVLNSMADDFASSFNGKILIAVQDRGRKWYVWDGHRYEIDKAPAFELRLQVRPPPAFAVFISNADLGRIPQG